MVRTDTLINYFKPTLMRRPSEDIPNSCSGLICLKATIIPDKIPVIPLNCRNLQIQVKYKQGLHLMAGRPLKERCLFS